MAVGGPLGVDPVQRPRDVRADLSDGPARHPRQDRRLHGGRDVSGLVPGALHDRAGLGRFDPPVGQGGPGLGQGTGVRAPLPDEHLRLSRRHQQARGQVGRGDVGVHERGALGQRPAHRGDVGVAQVGVPRQDGRRRGLDGVRVRPDAPRLHHDLRQLVGRQCVQVEGLQLGQEA
ncbi:hypothetical protein MHY85_04135 [Cellulomonas sp. ACRRI]|uniref:hypothetical protein n=1 Tax=Cellulomonas sp. ACRRI TaxID=2918188 RepID=UPI001EF359E4|nr:hypothetical protein [Cellulomonas sp. ACRRI]MCG7285163.1 hypothetical protein [Cellulomonas sp. ACRRI]